VTRETVVTRERTLSGPDRVPVEVVATLPVTPARAPLDQPPAAPHPTASPDAPAITAAPPTARRGPDQPAEAPRVRIGSIEVTVVPPPPPPIPPPAMITYPPPSVPVERLSRPFTPFGFGQG
jgi:hypothetical protein